MIGCLIWIAGMAFVVVPLATQGKWLEAIVAFLVVGFISNLLMPTGRDY